MFLCEKRISKQSFHYKMYIFLPEGLAPTYVTLFSVYICIFFAQWYGATLGLRFPPVICLCSAHCFAKSCCQKIELSKLKKIWSSLLSTWNAVAWLTVAKGQWKMNILKENSVLVTKTPFKSCASVCQTYLHLTLSKWHKPTIVVASL